MKENFSENCSIIDFSPESLFQYFYPSKKYLEGFDITPFFNQDFDKISYLYRYLTILGAKNVVVENEYLSKDYSRDYLLYYNSSFGLLDKYCKRIHFFKETRTDFTKTFKNILVSKNQYQKTKFWGELYLGFITIKPLPTSNIGYTLLQHFNFRENQENRFFFAARKYKVHVFGNEVEIESLAFQEQDTMLAACATMSVWFLQQKAVQTNLVIRKSPGEVTKDVGELSVKGERIFPNKDGLYVPELCRAIQKNGIEPLVRHQNDLNGDFNGGASKIIFNNYSKRLVYAYSSIGLPLIFILYDNKNEKESRHAVAVTGFKVHEKIEVINKKSIFYSDTIVDKFFVHDDQYGPFASLNINNEDIHGNNFFYNYKKEIDLISEEAEERQWKLDTVIIPVISKIKIDYEDIESIVAGINSLYGYSLAEFGDGTTWENIQWSIQLKFCDDYKKDLCGLRDISNRKKLDIITQNLPKYLWVASAFLPINNKKTHIVDLLFDAGGLMNSMLCVKAIYFQPQFEQYFKEWLNHKIKSPEFLTKFINKLGLSDLYYDYLRK